MGKLADFSPAAMLFNALKGHHGSSGQTQTTGRGTFPLGAPAPGQGQTPSPANPSMLGPPTQQKSLLGN